MRNLAPVAEDQRPALARMSRLAPLDDASLDLLRIAVDAATGVAARTEFIREGEPVGRPRLIAQGWAARVRTLRDGRRQFLSFLLPGDLVAHCRQSQPLAVATVIALTDLRLCHAPPDAELPALAEAYAVSHALDEAYLLQQIVRLGRLNAQERIGSLFLELHERLSLAGLAWDHGFELPLTQEMLADALGLTPVHINRMLRMLRAEDDAVWKSGRVTLPDPARLARKIAHEPARVTRR